MRFQRKIFEKKEEEEEEEIWRFENREQAAEGRRTGWLGSCRRRWSRSGWGHSSAGARAEGREGTRLGWRRRERRGAGLRGAGAEAA
jgi:hypothetical protein